MSLEIIKSSGSREKFDTRKLAESLMRAGAPEDVAFDIAAKVQAAVTPPYRTKAIFRLAMKMLRRHSRVSGMRYSLKKALSSLGPSGYPFERYVARILKEHGYSVEVDNIVDGYCVRHEVDIVAEKGDERYIVECKYHANAGNATDVKVALYVNSRFQDIRKAGGGKVVSGGILVTNTRCTTDAIKYAECAGLRIISWRYPEKDSLERMIEEKRLYPATILPAARRRPLEALFRNGLVLAQDIASMDEETFLERSGLDPETARLLKKQADELCPCT